MKGIEQGLILIALIVGFVLALNIGEARIDQEIARLGREHPSWSKELCHAVVFKRFSEKQIQQNPDWPWDLIARRELQFGMTTEMVRLSLGEPYQIAQHSLEAGALDGLYGPPKIQFPIHEWHTFWAYPSYIVHFRNWEVVEWW